MLWEIPLRNSQFLLSRSDPWRSPMWHRSHELADNVDWISQRAGFLMFWISTAISENDWIWFGTCLESKKTIWHGSLDWEVFACGGCKSCSASLLPRLSQQGLFTSAWLRSLSSAFVSLLFRVGQSTSIQRCCQRYWPADKDSNCIQLYCCVCIYIYCFDMLNQAIATWMARCYADFSLTLVTDMWQNSK